MTACLKRSLNHLGDTFWLLPAVMVLAAVLLAFVCVATLVYFVDHMANRINVDTVVDLVSDDVHDAMSGLTSDKPAAAPPTRAAATFSNSTQTAWPMGPLNMARPFACWCGALILCFRACPSPS